MFAISKLQRTHNSNCGMKAMNFAETVADNSFVRDDVSFIAIFFMLLLLLLSCSFSGNLIFVSWLCYMSTIIAGNNLHFVLILEYFHQHLRMCVCVKLRSNQLAYRPTTRRPSVPNQPVVFILIPKGNRICVTFKAS